MKTVRENTSGGRKASGRRKKAGESGRWAYDTSSNDPAPDLTPIVGAALRRLRLQRQLSLERLARASGVSRAMLGQVELGQSAPSVNVLWKIARALDVPLTTLLTATGGRGVQVMRAGDAKRLTSPDGSFSSRALFPFDQPRRAEFYELRLSAHAIEKAQPHPPGTMENLVLTAGELEIETAHERHRLLSGDAIVFEADCAHTYRNPGSVDAVMYLVMTYP